MRAVIKPSTARGEIAAPTSKSVAHRMLIAAALSEEESVISGVTHSDDVLATVECLRALGAVIEADGDTFKVRGKDMKSTAPSSALYAKESGSTLRFMIPIAALSGAKVLFTGSERLMSRPLSVYESIFKERELLLRKFDNFIIVDGPLPSGEYVIDGSVSSQFISGLLFALPLVSGDSVIKIIPPFASRSYVELTVDVLRKFGIIVQFEDELTITVPGEQSYKGLTDSVEGDYSGAAFLDAMNLFGSDVRISGLAEDSKQGDRIYRTLFTLLKNGCPEIDIENCPDLAPVLFTVAAAHNGACFTSTARLKIKESDRAEAMATELRKFGADIEVLENSVIIRKAELHASSDVLSGHNDHRVVMSLAVLATVYGGEIDGAEAVSKSYPNFFDDIKNIGIEATLSD